LLLQWQSLNYCQGHFGELAEAFNLPHKAGLLIISITHGEILNKIGTAGGFINAEN